MKIKKVTAKKIKDSRGEKTILVTIKTNVGTFSSSSPNGKSTGKKEAKSYKTSLDRDIETIKKFSEYFSKEHLEKFEDLRRVEDILDGNVGANSFFAFESAILKAIAKEKNREVWEIINPDAVNFPRLVGNCIGGGKHSKKEYEKKPDFQEFLIIPETKKVEDAFKQLKNSKDKIKILLEKKDKNFKNKKNDEDAWITSLNEKEVLDLLQEIKIPLGVDIAASGFCKRKKYYYKNPRLTRTPEEQFFYISNIIKNYNLIYIEDAFDEDDFEGFSKILVSNPNSLIVGDDLTTTNPCLLEKAITKKSINAIIVKPNQIGSMIKVKRVCEMAKENKIKIIFSHRSGETTENILADLAFGFQAEFIKCGITGKEREAKIKRLIEIEKSLNR